MWTRLPHARRALCALTLPCLLAVLGTGCDGGSDAGGDGDGGREAGADTTVAASCAWDKAPPALPMGGGRVRGVLRGNNRNTSTTCTRQRGTGGPEAIYLLSLRERALVALEVTSTIDTVLAVRRVCEDPLTEVACNDNPASSGLDPGQPGEPGTPVPPPPTMPGVPADAGVNPAPGESRDARLRVALEAGTYYVIVDEAEAFGVGGEFVLDLRLETPPAQTSCLSAVPVADGASLAAEELDLATELSPSCGVSGGRPALFYSATIPSGQRLTVRPTPTRGDRRWTPVVQLFSACSQPMCLASDRAAMDGSRVLRYVNNGPADQKVFIAVSSAGAVSGATFRLDVNIGEPVQNTSCGSARPLSDGDVLRGQDISEGGSSSSAACMRFQSPSLFYRATLFPQQRIHLSFSAQGRPGSGLPLVVAMLDSCDGRCGNVTGSGDFSFTNSGPAPRTIILEISSFSVPAPVFDMTVSMPLPPGTVSVSRSAGLSTSESGGRDSFSVSLTAAPIAPVTIPITSSNAAEGNVSPQSLSFDASNWSIPQTVTVTGVDDDKRDGPTPYFVRVGPATSGDKRYGGFDPDDVAVVNHDDEPGFTIVTPTQGSLGTSESGASARITVTLNRAPAAPVTLPFRSSDPGEATVSPAELVFTAANWNVPQQVTVAGVDDSERDAAQMYMVVIGPASSADPMYDGLDPEDLVGRNGDNELETLAPQVVSNNMPCSFVSEGQRIGVDEAGNIYVAMTCFGRGPADGGAGGTGGRSGGAPLPPPVADGGAAVEPGSAQVFVTVSQDGGHTWQPPVATGMAAQIAHIVGASGGVAVVVGIGQQGTAVTRSVSSGASWAPVRFLSSVGADVRVAAGGSRVVVSGFGNDAPSLWTSGDGGASFRQVEIPGNNPAAALAVDPDGTTVWLATSAGVIVVRRSSDGGVSFDEGSSVKQMFFGNTLVFGRTLLFGAGKEPTLLVAPLQQPDMSRLVPGIDPMFRFVPVLVADRADNVVVLESGDTSTVRARRLASGSAVFLAPRDIGPSDGPPAAVALSDSAIAVTMLRNGQVMAAVQTW